MPDEDNWDKLVYLMEYIRYTHMIPLTLSSNGNGILKWWVDVMFSVYPNMRGNYRGGLSLGRGFPIVRSTKQKLNTKTYTETEIMRVDNFMTALSWTQYFIAAQVYNVKCIPLHQDNKGSIIMENNMKALSSKWKKYINIWYFFITNRVNKGEISLVWYPTGDIIGDYRTKPIYGAII